MHTARYDQVADSYAIEHGAADDPVSNAVLTIAGPVAGRRVLDIACGHIDDLPACAAAVAAALRPGGIFAFGILHPCFAGGRDVSGSWPSGRSYYDEGRWTADGALSTLRRVVGANHRTLSTYVNTLHAHGLILDQLAEPRPADGWAAVRPDAASFPVFLVARCVRQPTAVREVTPFPR